MEITLITGNAGKLEEFRAMLPGFQLVAAKSDLTEIQALDISIVAGHKAKEAFENLQRPVLVDDSCIIIDEWNGLPGALTSWFMKAVGNQGILAMAKCLTSRAARIQTALAFSDGSQTLVFVGEVKGELSTEERGTNGFGFDPIFIPSNHSETLAEMSAEQKNEISMRRRAIDKFLDHELGKRN